MTNLPDPKTTQKIFAYIEQEKPHSRNFFRVLNIGRIFSVLAAIFISGLALAVFTYDGWFKMRFSDLVEISSSEIFSDFYFELLVVVALLIVGVYFIYKSTDWYLAKDMKWVIAGVVIVLFIVSGVMLGEALVEENMAIKPKDMVNTVTQSIKNLPYRKSSLLWQKLDNKNVFLGKIEDIDFKNNSIKVKALASNTDEVRDFKSSKPATLKRLSNDKIVIINYTTEEGVYVVNKIRIVNLSNRPLLKQFIEEVDTDQSVSSSDAKPKT